MDLKLINIVVFYDSLKEPRYSSKESFVEREDPVATDKIKIRAMISEE